MRPMGPGDGNAAFELAVTQSRILERIGEVHDWMGSDFTIDSAAPFAALTNRERFTAITTFLGGAPLNKINMDDGFCIIRQTEDGFEVRLFSADPERMYERDHWRTYIKALQFNYDSEARFVDAYQYMVIGEDDENVGSFRRQIDNSLHGDQIISELSKPASTKVHEPRYK